MRYFSSLSDRTTGKAVKVVTGNTFHLLTRERQLYKIGVADIVAPESGRPFGKKAEYLVFSQIFGKSVEVANANPRGREKYCGETEKKEINKS